MKKPNKKELENKLNEVLEVMGLDLTDPNFKDTPKRLAKMFTEELFTGLYEEPPQVAVFPNKEGTFLYTKVPFVSTCAHHFQPVKGVCHLFVDYTKCSSVVGLSKFNRLVNWCAARPTLQEDLTCEVFSTLSERIGTDYVGVIVEGTHSCVTNRGVCAAFSNTVTEKMGTDDNLFINKCYNYLKLEGV